MTRMKIFGAKGRLAPEKEKKGLLSGSGSFKIVKRPQRSWLGQLWDALRGLLGSSQTRRYARASKTLQKQSKANIQRADQLQKKVGRVRERK